MKAIDITCPTCTAKPGELCDANHGTGYEPMTGRFHRERVTAAGKQTREENLKAKAAS